MMKDLQNIRTYWLVPVLFIGLCMQAGVKRDSIAGIIKTSAAHSAYFCDACGCAGSGGSMGFSTLGDQDFFGTRYIHQKYRSRDGIYDNSPWINEYFNTLQVWGNFPVSEKIKISGILPYHFHHRDFPGEQKQSISGIGDVSLLAFYNLVAPYRDGFLPEQIKNYKHRLDLGLGVKLPTGNYDSENNEGSINPGFQVGTGSWDLILAATYSISYKSWGADINANYTWKTENDQYYEFGNQANYAVLIYRNFSWVYGEKLLPVGLLPFAGLAGEIYEQNKNYGQLLPDTSGNVLFGKLGFESSLGRVSVGANLMFPLVQHLNGGSIQAKHRVGLQFNYAL